MTYKFSYAILLEIQINQKRPDKNEQKLELDRAEFLLKQGLDEDESGNEEEAVELYLQAAELCLKAVSYNLENIIISFHL